MPPRVLASGPKPCGGNKDESNASYFVTEIGEFISVDMSCIPTKDK